MGDGAWHQGQQVTPPPLRELMTRKAHPGRRPTVRGTWATCSDDELALTWPDETMSQVRHRAATAGRPNSWAGNRASTRSSCTVNGHRATCGSEEESGFAGGQLHRPRVRALARSRMGWAWE